VDYLPDRSSANKTLNGCDWNTDIARSDAQGIEFSLRDPAANSSLSDAQDLGDFLNGQEPTLENGDWVGHSASKGGPQECGGFVWGCRKRQVIQIPAHASALIPTTLEGSRLAP